MAAHYNYVRFFFYNDDRVNPIYISSIRPHILKKHFAAYPELKNDAILYHDCDIILTKPVNWNHLLHDDIWYLSDTRFYIAASYIKSKKFGIYEEMCKIIGIDEAIPEANELNSGGAQYLMKNIDAEYWQKVEDDCNKLYQFFLDHLKEHPQTPEYHPIQKWTADMWAVLWNAWYFKHEVKVVPEMEFAWPMQGLDQWEKCNILHNAGVLDADHERMFFKGRYINKLPYDMNTDTFKRDLCSYKYIEAIMDTAKKSCLV